MTQLLNYLLTSTLLYGYPIIVLLIIGSEIGLPLPTGTVLLAAGSFSANGYLNFYWLIIIATLTSIIGDVVGYHVGNKIGETKVNTFLRKFNVNKIKVNSLSVFITRWLPLPLTVPVNLIAGYTKFSLKKFTINVFVGQLLWSYFYVYVGYLFGANWTALVTYLGNASILITLIVIGVSIYLYAKKFMKTN